VTARRYANYAQAQSLIEAIDDGSVGPRPLAVLREASEAMLLSREASRDSLEGDLDRVANELKRLVDAEALGTETAVRLWRVILATGPPGRPRTDVDLSAADPSSAG
jgi:hypothetical protein